MGHRARQTYLEKVEPRPGERKKNEVRLHTDIWKTNETKVEADDASIGKAQHLIVTRHEIHQLFLCIFTYSPCNGLHNHLEKCSQLGEPGMTVLAAEDELTSKVGWRNLEGMKSW